MRKPSKTTEPRKRPEPMGKSPTGASYRNAALIAQHRAQIAEWNLKGVEPYEICRRLNIGYSLLRYDLQAIQDSCDKAAIRDLDRAREIAVQEQRLIMSKAFEAWDRSVTTKRRTHKHTAMKRGRGKGKNKKPDALRVVRGSTMEEETNGDPRFLQMAAQCSMNIAKLRGVIQEMKGSSNDVAPIAASGQATYIIMPASAIPREAPKDITPPAETKAIAA